MNNQGEATIRVKTINEFTRDDDVIVVVNNDAERDDFLARFNAEKMGWDEGGGGRPYKGNRYPIYLSLDMFGRRGVYEKKDIKDTPFGPELIFSNWHDICNDVVSENYKPKYDWRGRRYDVETDTYIGKGLDYYDGNDAEEDDTEEDE